MRRRLTWDAGEANLDAQQIASWGIGQVLITLLFFASNAIYPISMMPGWVKVIAWINPLSYEVNILRSPMLRQPATMSPTLSLGVLPFAAVVQIWISVRLYTHMGVQPATAPTRFAQCAPAPQPILRSHR